MPDPRFWSASVVPENVPRFRPRWSLIVAWKREFRTPFGNCQETPWFVNVPSWVVKTVIPK